MFDKDKVGKDKSLGRIEVDPRDLDNAKWFPLKVNFICTININNIDIEVIYLNY